MVIFFSAIANVTAFSAHEEDPSISKRRYNPVAASGEITISTLKDSLITAHSVLMLIAWPMLSFTAIFFAAWMKPALPNGEWFQVCLPDRHDNHHHRNRWMCAGAPSPEPGVSAGGGGGSGSGVHRPQKPGPTWTDRPRENQCMLWPILHYNVLYYPGHEPLYYIYYPGHEPLYYIYYPGHEPLYCIYYPGHDPVCWHNGSNNIMVIVCSLSLYSKLAQLTLLWEYSSQQCRLPM